LQAAIERSDPAAVFAALQPTATTASSLAMNHQGLVPLWRHLQGHFAQHMVSMCRDLEAELARLTEQQLVVQQMCVCVVQTLAVTRSDQLTVEACRNPC
jgi:hypothetical protein